MPLFRGVPMKKFGKVFYSNNIQFLEGVAAGASYVNDGPIVIHNIEVSDKAEYSHMLLLEDTESDELCEGFC